MRKILIDKRLYNVIEPNEYDTNYNPKFTAIECNNHQTVLPINSRPNDSTPGVYFYNNGMVGVVNKPVDESKYSSEHIMDISKAKDVGELIKYNDMIRDIQNDIITTSDNVLQLNISERDTPEMKVLKQAINSKGVDKKQYEDRFSQFQNDMRLLKGNSITLSKLISICSAFDISAELTLKDKEDIPNPMGREYSVDLTVDRTSGVS